MKMKDLPEGVYVDSKGISYHHREFGVLSRTDEPDWKMWKALDDFQNQRKKTTLQDLWDAYSDSAEYKVTSPDNQTNRTYEIAPLIRHFKQRPVDAIKLEDVTKYIRKREKEAPSMALNERKFLQQLCNFGAQLGMCEQKITNSIKVVEGKKKQKVILDWHFERLLQHASPIGGLYMVGAFLFAARMQDLRAMRPEQLGPTGVMIQQLKTGVTQNKEWNDDVEAWAIEATKRYEGIKQRLAEQGKPPPNTLLCKTDGGIYGYQAVRSMFKRAKEKLEKELGLSIGTISYTFHAIKHTSITNFVGNKEDKQQFSGHKSRDVLNMYDHSIQTTPSNVKLKKKEVEITAKSDFLRKKLDSQNPPIVRPSVRL